VHNGTTTLEDAYAEKEDSLNTFLNDPERVIKIFLSSYLRKQGLIWCVLILFTPPPPPTFAVTDGALMFVQV